MYPDPNGCERLNSFALVSYIPDPLATFLDQLRQELVPNCFLAAHVTVLPPRPLFFRARDAWKCVQTFAPKFRPFEVALTEVEIFPISDVIYLSIGTGQNELREMHEQMNRDALHYREPFPYIPHVTLAQNLRADELDELIHVARQRWQECCHPKSFRVEEVVFVQNTRRNDWLDLGRCSLGQDHSRLLHELSDQTVG